ncbi:DUF3631 domain-containing protein [Bradyrhizobium sp. 149]|uniref:DUF3631 domain-containing protein n=1 Tax=Bradyrhizobium sp. 149 TaxID=2782624 RepID=UPI001FFA03C9|nr:DUF3631 domain-containing protein [Bradyrhizobium sp. 149]MCK1653057.1 DUF3631 domain-containing protein [Bradyrhizobium sp. 149]
MEHKHILDQVYEYVGRFIYYPSEHARILHVAWIAHTHLVNSFNATPRLAILSPEKRSGKTRLLEITKLLVQNPVAMVSPSPASLYSLIEAEKIPPTFLIDEIGRLFERKEISDFLSIVEAGFQPGQTVRRVSLENGRTVEEYKTYAPILMAGIDNNRMQDTIEDRSVIVRMKRNVGPRLKYRPSKHAAEGLELRSKLAEWAKAVSDKSKEIEPIMPDELNDREQDKFEPLFVVGILADQSKPVTDVTADTDVTAIPGWLDKIRNAALALSNEDRETETENNSTILLRDAYKIFGEALDIKTSELLDGLHRIEESPWSTYNYGKPMDGRGLAKLLKPYRIAPTTIRFGTGTDKGYHRSDFEDAWKRYLGIPSKTSVTIVTMVTPVTLAPSSLRINVNGKDEILAL